MLLVIDVGNSNIVLGVYDAERLVRSWRLSTDKSRTSDEYAVLLHSLFDQAGLAFSSVSAAIISSVVPPLTGVMEAISHDFFNLTPYVVGPGIKTGMPIHYDNPREVGADRIVNAVAAYEKHKCPLVIVDFVAVLFHLTRSVHDGAANVITDVCQLGRFVNGFQGPSEGKPHSTKPII